MAVTSDGTQSFGIEVSPVAINSVDYIAEDFNVTYAGNRVDINDSNGEPLGSTTVPQRVEFSATLQYATSSTASPTIGHEMTLATGRNAATYVITEIGDAQTQGDYAKCSVSGYEKIN
ncbi:MAG: hypothetical protein GKR97_10170 [Rhizobiaceae bacterium]|jgi:hypothetical protein|nr:hypothetical protein [Rhizobiaceae bacterium]